MNIAWTGKQEFLHPAQQKSFDSKIAHSIEAARCRGERGKKGARDSESA